jgi:hypothetical protein
MGWSDYSKFVDVEWRKIPTNPGAYYVRCVNESGKPGKTKGSGVRSTLFTIVILKKVGPALKRSA